MLKNERTLIQFIKKMETGKHEKIESIEEIKEIPILVIVGCFSKTNRPVLYFDSHCNNNNLIKSN